MKISGKMFLTDTPFFAYFSVLENSASFSLFKKKKNYIGCGQGLTPPPLFTDLSVTNRFFFVTPSLMKWLLVVEIN